MLASKVDYKNCDTAYNKICRNNFMFVFPCIISLYYIKNQQDATLAVLFISNCKITLHVKQSRYRPREAQRVPGSKVHRFHDNGTGWW